MHQIKKTVAVVAACFLTFSTACFAAQGTVTADALNIRSNPTTDSTVLSKVDRGQILDIQGKENSFYRISFNGGTAYASTDYVSVNVNLLGTVTAAGLNVRSSPSTSSAVATTLSRGDEVKITGSSGSWYEILYKGDFFFVHKNYVVIRSYTDASSRDGSGFSRDGSKVVELSKNYIGTPYVHGGSSPSGFDCSGFTSYIYSKFGVDLPRTAASQAAMGTPVSRDDLCAGDLVFFNTYGGISHVGIYIGGGDFIHATVPGDIVRISNLGAAYYSARYVTARRIIK